MDKNKHITIKINEAEHISIINGQKHIPMIMIQKPIQDAIESAISSAIVQIYLLIELELNND